MDGWPDSDGLDSGWGNLGQRDEPLGKRAAPVRRPVEQNNTNNTIHRLTAKRNMVGGHRRASVESLRAEAGSKVHGCVWAMERGRRQKRADELT